MNKIAMVTGATSGIGKETALILAKSGYDVIITGRRSNLLHSLEKEIKDQSGNRALAIRFDIRVREEVNRAVAKIPAEWKNIEILVNNAGLASGYNDIQDGNMEDWEQMIDTNIKGLLFISKEIIPIMTERKSGHIINIGSIAGKEVYPKGNVYCATKYAVDALTKAMRMDLLEHGIKVTSISPGAVDTEFSIVRFKGNIERAKQIYEGFTPLYAKDVAEAVLFAVSRPPHVNVNDMVITCTDQANASIFNKRNK